MTQAQCSPLITGKLWRVVVFLVFIQVVFSQQEHFSTTNEPGGELPHFLSQWQSLGPFRIGTREAVWGADPLEAFGGFPSLAYDANVTYRSPLTANATIQWRRHTFEGRRRRSGSSIDIELSYGDVDWRFAQDVYGWAGLQYQAWMRGHILNNAGTNRTVRLFAAGILEYWINDEHVFGGDYYGFGKAPQIVSLNQGINVIQARLIRDVRANGAIGAPSIVARFRVEPVSEPLVLVGESVVLPSLVSGRLTGRFFRVTVRNEHHSWIQITECEATVPGLKSTFAEKGVISIAPGQSRPISMEINIEDVIAPVISVVISYRDTDHDNLHKFCVEVPVEQSDIYEPHRMTFLHPSGTVSYAIIRPPAERLLSDKPLPVLLILHGSGVEADSDQVRHSLDQARDIPAWVIFPTGMTPWCGDDWHSWGHADAIAAVNNVVEWIKLVNWTGPGVRTDKIMVSGHSNGGHGTWYFATHKPDYTFAAAPASGYVSIQAYVPYTLWVESDPMQSAVVTATLNNYRHEHLVENVAHMPLLQQHGAKDDNVPPYHSRLMSTLRAQIGANSDYVELPDRPHWFEGAMATPQLREFYRLQLSDIPDTIDVPDSFTFICPNSNDLGSMYGIVVDQLIDPGRLGRVKVSASHCKKIRTWTVETVNVQRFHICLDSSFSNPPQVVALDDFGIQFTIQNPKTALHLVKDSHDIWVLGKELTNGDIAQRHGHQRGALDAILNTKSPFQLVAISKDAFPWTVQTSRNMLQYFAADSAIWTDSEYEKALEQKGNVITFVIGTKIPSSRLPNYPITINEKGVVLKHANGRSNFIAHSAGLGGVMLRPLEKERLELLVWGFDEAGMQQAARLIPTLTGAGQPDFVFMSQAGRWLGHAGAPAMGLFDFSWNISTMSYA